MFLEDETAEEIQEQKRINFEAERYRTEARYRADDAHQAKPQGTSTRADDA